MSEKESQFNWHLDDMLRWKNVVYVLYCTCHPFGGRRYIGVTTGELRKRIQAHLGEARRGKKNLLVYKWIRAHGTENIEWDVIDTAPTIEALHELERRYIATERDDGTPLANVTDGGEGVPGLPVSDEQRWARSGPGAPAYGRRGVDSWNHGRKRGSGTLERMRTVRLGYKYTSEELARNEAYHVRGEAVNTARFTEAEVVRIMDRLLAGERVTALASEMGVNRESIGRIKRGQTWGHIEHPLRPRRVMPAERRAVFLAEADQIRGRHAAGETIRDLATETGRSYAAIYKIVRGLSWQMEGQS